MLEWSKECQWHCLCRVLKTERVKVVADETIEDRREGESERRLRRRWPAKERVAMLGVSVRLEWWGSGLRCAVELLMCCQGAVACVDEVQSVTWFVSSRSRHSFEVKWSEKSVEVSSLGFFLGGCWSHRAVPEVYHLQESLRVTHPTPPGSHPVDLGDDTHYNVDFSRVGNSNCMRFKWTVACRRW